MFEIRILSSPLLHRLRLLTCVSTSNMQALPTFPVTICGLHMIALYNDESPTFPNDYVQLGTHRLALVSKFLSRSQHLLSLQLPRNSL